MMWLRLRGRWGRLLLVLSALVVTLAQCGQDGPEDVVVPVVQAAPEPPSADNSNNSNDQATTAAVGQQPTQGGASASTRFWKARHEPRRLQQQMEGVLWEVEATPGNNDTNNDNTDINTNDIIYQAGTVTLGTANGSGNNSQQGQDTADTTTTTATTGNDSILPYASALQSYTLANGLQVVLLPLHGDTSENDVSLHIVVQVGSKHDNSLLSSVLPAEVISNSNSTLTGMAHWLEHVLYRGTSSVTAQQYHDAYAALDGNFNAWTTRDQTHYESNFVINSDMENTLERILQVEANRFVQLTLSTLAYRWSTSGTINYNKTDAVADMLQQEATSIYQEYQQLYVSPDYPLAQLLQTMEQTVYSKLLRHPYRHGILGTEIDLQQRVPSSSVERANSDLQQSQFQLRQRYRDVFVPYAHAFAQTYYRPDNMMLFLAGNFDTTSAQQSIEQYWGSWMPPQSTFASVEYQGDLLVSSMLIDATTNTKLFPKYAHDSSITSTTPWIVVSFVGPGFGNTTNSTQQRFEFAVMTVIAEWLDISLQTSLLDRDPQLASSVLVQLPTTTDPYPLTIVAVIPRRRQIWQVRDILLGACSKLRTMVGTPRDQDQLHQILSHLYYQVGTTITTSQLAKLWAEFLAWTRGDVDAVHDFLQFYHPGSSSNYNVNSNSGGGKITIADVRRVASKYLVDERLVTVTLANENVVLPEPPTVPPSVSAASTANIKAGSVDAMVAQYYRPSSENQEDAFAWLQLEPSDSYDQLVHLQLRWAVGSVDDPPNREGLARVTAELLFVPDLYAMATNVQVVVDHEFTAISVACHVDLVWAVWHLLVGPLLLEQDSTTVWTETQFKTVKRDIRESIARNVLGQEAVLVQQMLEEYVLNQHYPGGYIQSIKALRMEHVQAFAREYYTQQHLVVGVQGPIGEDFVALAQADLRTLPLQGKVPSSVTAQTLAAAPPSGRHATIVQTTATSAVVNLTSVAVGILVDCNWTTASDFVALWVAVEYLQYSASWFSSNADRTVSIQQPSTELPLRRFPMLEWVVSPVDSLERAQFEARLAFYSLHQLLILGMTENEVTTAKTQVLEKLRQTSDTQDQVLVQALNYRHFFGSGGTNGVASWIDTITDALSKLTATNANTVIRQYFQEDNVAMAFATPAAEELRQTLLSEVGTSSAMMLESVASPSEEAFVLVQNYPLGLQEDHIEIVEVDDLFQGNITAILEGLLETPTLAPNDDIYMDDDAKLAHQGIKYNSTDDSGGAPNFVVPSPLFAPFAYMLVILTASVLVIG